MSERLRDVIGAADGCTASIPWYWPADKKVP